MTFRSQKLINADDTLFIFIDHQPQMAFGVTSIDRQLLKNNTVALAKAAKLFGVPIDSALPGKIAAAGASLVGAVAVLAARQF